jgi:hypothetical protein
MKLYVYGKSKQDINARLAKGDWVTALAYEPATGEEGGEHRLNANLRLGTVVVVYDRHGKEGNPLGREYGLWGKDRIL